MKYNKIQRKISRRKCNRLEAPYHSCGQSNGGAKCNCGHFLMRGAC